MKLKVHALGNCDMRMWLNFREHVNATYPDIPYEEAKAIELAKWGAKDVPHSCFIEFERESDSTFFALRWS